MGINTVMLIIGCAMILAGIVLLIYIFKDSYLDS